VPARDCATRWVRAGSFDTGLTQEAPLAWRR
jgi:hypothetical protein